MIPLLLAALLCPQDLWSRADPVRASGSRDRLDLSVGPLLDPSKCQVRPGTVGVDLKISPDFACGTFDVAAAYRSIFNKNLKEELLGAILEEAKAELAGSAMVLACQTSPTLCDALKHYKVISGEALGLEFRQCQAVEAASAGFHEGLKARAIKACLAEAQARGVPLDEAMASCQKADEVRNLEGSKVKQIDLAKEAGRLLGLSKEAQGELSRLAGGLQLGADRVHGDLRVRPVAERYDQARRAYAGAWAAAVEASVAGRPPGELGALVPEGSPRATVAEVQRLAAMPEADRAVVIGVLSSALALQEASRRVGEAQAALEAAAGAADETLKARLRDEAARLGAELRRLRDEYELAELVARARIRGDAEAGLAQGRRAAAATEPWRAQARAEEESRATARWGAGCAAVRK